MAFADSGIAKPSAPRFEQHPQSDRLLVLGTGAPRLSWTIAAAPASYRQAAYEVEVTTPAGVSIHTVQSEEQLLQPWPALPLGARDTASVRIRVTDGATWSEWGDAGAFEVGLLEQADWHARFISPAEIGGIGEPAPILSTKFRVASTVVAARLYITAHGIYTPKINGAEVGDELFAPGWTSYESRLPYQTYDITTAIIPGDNTIEVLLGNGWYRGRLGWKNEAAHYGSRLALLAQLEIETENGTREIIGTDARWTASEGAVIADDLYDGQLTDLRHARRSTTSPVEVVPADFDRLFPAESPAVRRLATIPAERTWTSPAGKFIVDFGQNLVGWVRLRVRPVPEDSRITVRHAEVLENGELATRPLRSAKATDCYIAAGGEGVFEPQLTFHGFRYADITGVDPADILSIEAVVIGSDLPRTGWFDSSHELLNRLHENVVWSARGNFLSVPTDCPQRDERLGWTGDAQVFAPTAAFLFDCAAFLANWMRDLAADQYADGSVPFVIPDVLHDPSPAAAAWGDAATVIPYVLWERYGDTRVLSDQLESMRAWVDRVADLAGPDRLWQGGFQFGDWLDPTAPPDQPALAKADPAVVATAHLARSAGILAHAAALLGHRDYADRYERLAQEVREAFARAYVDDAGLIRSDAQTVYALAICWGLLPQAAQQVGAGVRLAQLVRDGGYHIGTGFVGTPLTMHALSSTNHVAEAFGLLLQTTCPSWLYPVTMGATTIWERWDSMLPDGSVNPGEMTSFNHYALGAVADWLHCSLAGLAPLSPGYRTILVKPVSSAEISHASARHLTPYGTAAVAWRREHGQFTLDVVVPVGASAEVHLPDGSMPIQVGHGTHAWSIADPCPPSVEDVATTTVRR